MRVRELKWLSLIIPLLLSFALIDVSSSPGTIVYVDPPGVIDDSLQAPSTFTVSLDVSDVENLFSWQAYLSWDPSVLQVNSWLFGDFLKGNPDEAKEVVPYDDLTEPAFTETKSPSSNTPGAGGGWTNPLFAYSDNKFYATCNTPDADHVYGAYAFSTGSLTEVTSLEVGTKSYCPETDLSERDRIDLEVSNDGGSTWGPTHEIPSSETELLIWTDVTSDFSWTPAMLTNFKARVRYKQVGASATTVYLNWIPARVLDTLQVDNPVLSHDNNLDSYASFQYSQRDASFVIGNSTGDPYYDSTILQVDLKVRYEATASSLNDKYRILYYGGSYANPTPPAKHTLVDWTSAASPLATHVWTNPTNPYGGSWKWADVKKLQIEFQTDKQGGDPTAVFDLYEVWLTVTYVRPTYTTYYLDNPAGYIFLMASTQGSYPLGIYGSGWLADVTFQVLSYGYTGIDINETISALYTPQDVAIPFTPQDGYFNNLIPGDMTDDTPGVPPDAPDGDSDGFDLGAFADAYGSIAGQPRFNILADLTDNSPGVPPDLPDGDVDGFDLGVFADNYGRSIP